MTATSVADDAATMWATMTEDVRADYGKDYFDYIMSEFQKTASGGVSK